VSLDKKKREEISCTAKQKLIWEAVILQCRFKEREKPAIHGRIYYAPLASFKENTNYYLLGKNDWKFKFLNNPRVFFTKFELLIQTFL